MTAEVRAPETEPSWTLRLDDAFLNTLDVWVMDDFEERLAETHLWVEQSPDEMCCMVIVRGWYGTRDVDRARRALRPIMERLTKWRDEHGQRLTER